MSKMKNLGTIEKLMDGLIHTVESRRDPRFFSK